MGCCTHFHKTWWPGNSSDVIDPNKTFNFDRRVGFIKKLILIVILIVLLIALIFLVYHLYTSDDSVTSRVDSSNLTSSPNKRIEGENDSLEQTKLHQSSIFPTIVKTKSQENSSFTPHSENLSTEPPPGTSTIHQSQSSILFPNGTSVEDVPTFEADLSTTNLTAAEEYLPTSTSDNNATTLMESDPPPTSLHTNNDTEEFVMSTTTPSSHYLPSLLPGSSSNNQLCSSIENVVECIGLSKNFKTLTTFHNSSMKHNSSVEGYVLMRMENSTWYPYCHQQWTLGMGYKLCHGLGFRRLIKLQTMDINQLMQRMSQKKVRKETTTSFMHGDDDKNNSGSQQKHQQTELLVLTSTAQNPSLKKSNLGQFHCEAGFIACS